VLTAYDGHIPCLGKNKNTYSAVCAAGGAELAQASYVGKHARSAVQKV